MRKAMTLALVGQQHCLVVGPKGVGKTEFHTELFNALDMPDEDKAVISGYKGAGEEILLSFLSPKGLEEDEFRYLPGPSILNRQLVYIDEIEKLARLTQQILLQVMQSRRFSRAGIDYAVPLDTLFAGGNGVPEDPAVRDRFGIQIPLDKSPELMERIAGWALSSACKRRQERHSIKWEMVLLARQEARKKRVNEEARDLMVQLSVELDMSPRRLAQNVVPTCQANAVLMGQQEVTPEVVMDAIPYVAIHDGELTTARFATLQERFKEAMLKAKRQATLRRVTETIQARIEKLNHAVHSAQSAMSGTKLRAVRDHLQALRAEVHGLPNPDACDTTTAQCVQNLLDASQAAYQGALAKLGLNF